MKPIISALLLIALPLSVSLPALSASAAPVAPSSADLAAVAAHIRATGTMTASFVQTGRDGRGLTGTLLMKRPGHIRFEYQKGVPLLIVADGKSLNMIDYEVGQVQRWPIGNSPLSALLDPNRDLTKFAKLQPTANPRVLSVEVRDPKRPEYGTITMIFLRQPGAPAGLTLDSWVALDSQNNRTTVRLTNARYNMAIPDSRFRWSDPRAAMRKGGK